MGRDRVVTDRSWVLGSHKARTLGWGTEVYLPQRRYVVAVRILPCAELYFLGGKDCFRLFLPFVSITDMTASFHLHHLLPLQNSFGSSNVWKYILLSGPPACRWNHNKAVFARKTLCVPCNPLSRLFSWDILSWSYFPCYPIPRSRPSHSPKQLNLDNKCLQSHNFVFSTYFPWFYDTFHMSVFHIFNFQSGRISDIYNPSASPLGNFFLSWNMLTISFLQNMPSAVDSLFSAFCQSVLDLSPTQFSLLLFRHWTVSVCSYHTVPITYH